jgi:hypothetical protein
MACQTKIRRHRSLMRLLYWPCRSSLKGFKRKVRQKRAGHWLLPLY